MTELRIVAREWLEGSRDDVATGVNICRNIPEAAVFISYASCYSKERQINEIVKFLTAVVGVDPLEEAYEHPASVAPAPRRGRPSGQKQATTETVKEQMKILNGGDRPQHFDTWYEQMSPTLQEKVAGLGDLWTKKKFHRGEIERLASDPNHSKEDMAFNATACVAYENKIQAIYDMAQVEWDELNGRSVQNEVKQLIAQAEQKADKIINSTNQGSVEVVEKPKAPKKQAKAEPQQTEVDNTRTDDEYMQTLTYQQILDHPVLTDLQKKFWLDRRINNARKYLRDKLVAPLKPKKIEMATAYIEDLRIFGHKITPKEMQNIKAAGIEVPAEMLETEM